MNDKIYTIESEATATDVLQLSEKCIKLVKDTLETIRTIVLEEDFKNTQDEIYFFKNVKPQVYSKLIYYAKLFNIESKRPRGSSKPQKKYLDYQIVRLQDYFNDNLEFYQYFRRGGTSLDLQYFIRGKDDIRLHPDNFHFFTDDKFSTSHDSTVATIMAYDMLIVYLKQEIDKLENIKGMETIIKSNQFSSKLFWTASKTDLIELIYAIHSSGAINSGTADIKEMAIICEQIFNIDLSNYYHTFVEIRSRKTNNTKFIDKLKESLIQRIEESDE
ncbi:RteC domain-containing protein [Xanthomarina gelatinilytica]|uniref:RteC domain-containing protein n=1 Tax=Xanthomarina gelatinilytica TaxID=1137281 RepID=UPI003AA89FC7